MTLNINHESNRYHVQEAALDAARLAYDAGQAPVILVPQYQDATALKQVAAPTPASFGITISAFAHWVADAWELYGDGRALIGSSDRRMALMGCLQDEAGLAQGPGAVQALAAIARDALPFVGEADGMTEEERSVTRLLEAYAERIGELGFVEYSEALVHLADRGDLPHSLFVIGKDPEAIAAAERHLLDRLGATAYIDDRKSPAQAPRAAELEELQRMLYQPDPAHPVTPRGSVRFLFPTGPNVRMQALADTLIALACEFPQGSIIVALPDAREAFERVGGRLDAQGVGCSIEAAKPFRETDIGRAIVQIATFMRDDAQPDVPLIADYAINKASGIGTKAAYGFEQRWKADRLIDKNCILTDLTCYADDQMRAAIGSLENGRSLEAIAPLTSYVASRRGWTDAYRAEQLAALAVAGEAFDAAAKWGVPDEAALALLEQQSVPVRLALGDGRVRFMMLADAQAEPAGSCDALFIGSLTATSFPVRSGQDAVQGLLARFDAASDSDPIDEMRRIFWYALESAREAVVLERPLNDGRAEPLYPAVVFEEAVECYHGTEGAAADIDDATLLPATLLPYAHVKGEEGLLYDIAGTSTQQVAFSQPWPELGSVSPDRLDRIVLPRRYAGELFPDGMDLSPTQIESYLECPYQWFAKRRLSLSTPGEQVGPIEKGNFIHKVLKLFYLRFRESGKQKVDEASLAFAKEMIGDVFGSQAQLEFGEDAGSRYVPITEMELRDREDMLANLVDYLDREARMLPGFTPRHFEWSFGKTEPFTYAGCNITGTIDRIDIDEARGYAVVIDYKSSVSKDYDLYPPKAEEFRLPRKMQALMYAKVVEKLLGLRVVAAVYVNPLKPGMSGAFDATVLDAAHLPGLKPDTNRVPCAFFESFAEMLDRTEAEVARRMESLAEGDIRPDPTGPEACKYCPVMLCEKRIG